MCLSYDAAAVVVGARGHSVPPSSLSCIISICYMPWSPGNKRSRPAAPVPILQRSRAEVWIPRCLRGDEVPANSAGRLSFSGAQARENISSSLFLIYLIVVLSFCLVPHQDCLLLNPRGRVCLVGLQGTCATPMALTSRQSPRYSGTIPTYSRARQRLFLAHTVATGGAKPQEARDNAHPTLPR